MQVDFLKVKKLNKLGSGMIGTTYLALYNNEKYALKIQKILPSHINKNFKDELWRELDLYNYINSLNSNDSKFFTKLYGYEIYDNCKHKQIRPLKIEKVNDFTKKLVELDKSNWCIKFLIDYQGKITLGKYISKNILSYKQTYSFIFQIIKMIFILYKGGYSHNDLHMYNIMISKTNEKSFNFSNNINIPYYGYKLTAIDYGKVLHKKYNLSGLLFKKKKKKWLFYEINRSISNLITNTDKYIYNCKLKKKLRPTDRKNFNPTNNLIYNIIEKHLTFWNNCKNKYTNNKNVIKLLKEIEKKN